MVPNFVIPPEVFALVILPILIFFARVVDVSLGTIRIIFVSKGVKYLAPVVGFFEVLIWLLAIGEIFKSMGNWVTILAYAAGFATGTFVGIKIEERLSVGKVRVRIITSEKSYEIIEGLKNARFATTSLHAIGTKGEVTIISVIIDRKNIKKVAKITREINPTAFYSIEDMRSVSESPMLAKKKRMRYHLHRPARKGK